MRGNILGTKALLKQPPILESVQGGERLVPLLDSIHNYSQCGLDQGREQYTISSVLHQPDLLGS